MEVVLPSSPTMDFDFGSGRSSPSINYLSAPSSPRRFGQCFLSAPASPTRITELYRQFDDFSMAMERSQSRGGGRSVSAIPFDWEEKPGTPKAAAAEAAATSPGDEFEFDFDFAFDVNAEADKGSRSAEELFSGGKILPLKPPPRLQVAEVDEQVVNQRSPLIPSSAARSPRSSIAQGKKMLRDFFLPRRKKQSEAFRISEFSWEEERQNQLQQKQEQSIKQSSDQTASLTSSSSSKVSSSSKRWSFKDFLLFRSASEGRGSDKDPLRKYAPRPQVKKLEQAKNSSFRSTSSDIRNASFRSTESSASGTGSRRRISAHEMHYALNKAASDDLKKKTFLPYKQGILGPGFGSR